MMIRATHRSNPTVQVPPYDISDDPMANISPLCYNHHSNAVSPTKCSALDALTAFQRFLPSNMNSLTALPEIEDTDIPLDAFSSDHFRIYDFKVRRCARARSHDWTACPYAHPGEKARRRDPRKFLYSGTPCPDFKKGQCVRGDACEYAHGVFECWLHPTRYRTQPCKDGTLCRRKVCFFAHTNEQLRFLPLNSVRNNNGFLTESYDGSPSRLGIESFIPNSFGSSPTSTLYANESPPLSPCESMGFNSVSGLSGSMRGLQIGKGSRVNMSTSPPSWGVQMGCCFGSFPTRKMTRSGLGELDVWDQPCEEEPVMERVESGRDIRAKMYAKLSKDNSLSRVDSVGSGYNVVKL